MLGFFHMAPFACYTVCIVIFSCCTFFRVGLFLCIALFDALLHVAMISFFIIFLLQSAHVAVFLAAVCSYSTNTRGVAGTPTNI